MGTIEDRLEELGQSLPPAQQPVANYVGCKRSGELESVRSVEKLQGFVRSAADFIEQPLVINGAAVQLDMVLRVSSS